MEAGVVTVFISYRRRTHLDEARKLFAALTEAGLDVFLDEEDLSAGRFDEILVKEIRKRRYFLVLLTPRALRMANREEDFFRGEIRTALQSECVTVPILLDGFKIEDLEEHLGVELAGLSRHNALAIPVGADYLTVRDRLLEFLGRPAAATEVRALDPTPVAGKQRREAGEKLRELLDSALEGQSRFVLLGGEAGTGKRHLIADLENLARRHDVAVVRGRFSESEKGFPYQGFCELIQAFFRNRDLSRKEEVDFADLAADLLEVFPLLGEVRELKQAAQNTAPSAPRSIDVPERDETWLFHLLYRGLVRLAGSRPVVLVIENVHRDLDAIKALRTIVPLLLGRPRYLILGTYRPDEVNDDHPFNQLLTEFSFSPLFTRMRLEPLSFEDMREFLEADLGPIRIRDEDVARIYEATAGIPFLTQLYISWLRETGQIRRDDDGALSVLEIDGSAEGGLPPTILEVVEQRLSGLSPAQKEILGITSVLGLTFSDQDLRELLEGLASPDRTTAEIARGLDDALDVLERHRILKGAPRRLRFTSSIFREVVYGHLTPRQRRKLHLAHARILEARPRASFDPQITRQLLHHYSEAGAGDQTVQYGIKLARFWLEMFSPENAIQAAVKALKVLKSPVDPDEVKDLLHRTGEVFEVLARAHGAAGRAQRAYHEASKSVGYFEKDKSARGVEAVAKMSLFAAEMAWSLLKLDIVQDWVDRGLGPAREVGQEEVLHGLLVLGARVANLRANYPQARDYKAQADRLQQAGENDSEECEAGGILKAAMLHPIYDVDPHVLETDAKAEVMACVYETLLVSDADGNWISGLCQSWERSSDEGSLVFRLKPDVLFSDGSRVSASEVKRSFEHAAGRGKSITDRDVPPAFTVIRGYETFGRGEADEISGIEVRGGDPQAVVFHLTEPLPHFPALLTDSRTAILREVGDAAPAFVGTGPFKIESASAERVQLVRNPRHGPRPLLQGIDFQYYRAEAIEEALRAKILDLGLGLIPQDLDLLLRDPDFRSSLRTATKKNVNFIVFNQQGPVAGLPEVRQAMIGVVRTHHLAPRTLGRFALPAVSMIPPSVLGHDPARRRHVLTIEEAKARLAACGRLEERPVRLTALLHPSFQGRYAKLKHALFDQWSQLGIEIEERRASLSDLLEDNAGIDLLLCQWNADYNDPESFTRALFHSGSGVLRHYYSSLEADRILDRTRHGRNAEVVGLFREFEDLLADAAAVLPLFHDVDYRIAGPRVRNLRLGTSPPYVNYSTLARAATVPSAEPIRGEVRVPIAEPLRSLEPCRGRVLEYFEVTSNLFETLMRLDRGASPIPWLAESVEPRRGGQEYRVILRPEIRFHDGRPLTVRDVRYTFEQVLRSPFYYLLNSVRGAADFRAARRGDLEGFQIESDRAFSIELEEPVAFFRAILSTPGLAIVPEGGQPFSGNWTNGCAGTGPFRLIRFEPGKLVDLERNPDYWRSGHPRIKRLSFHLGIGPEESWRGFLSGRFTAVADLRPPDLAELRKDPKYLAGYAELPRLSTYFMAFNAHSGRLTNRKLREALDRALDVESLLRETLGEQVTPALGLLPPNLLGRVERRQTPQPATDEDRDMLTGLSLRFTVSPSYRRQYAVFWERLRSRLEELGINFSEEISETPEDLSRTIREGRVDLAFHRWIADYPDSDNFFFGLLHAQEGVLARFCSTETMNSLLVRARRDHDPASRFAAYQAIEQELMSDILLIPFFHEKSYRFIQPTTRDLRLGLCSPEVHYDELRSDVSASSEALARSALGDVEEAQPSSRRVSTRGAAV